MNILLIEPDRLLGDIYKKSLEQSGNQVYLARSAQEAVSYADDVMPEAVVLELQLAGHGGVEFLHEFRSYDEWQEIPIILHTLVPSLDIIFLRHFNIIRHLYKPATNLRQLNLAVNEIFLAGV